MKSSRTLQQTRFGFYLIHVNKLSKFTVRWAWSCCTKWQRGFVKDNSLRPVDR